MTGRRKTLSGKTLESGFPKPGWVETPTWAKIHFWKTNQELQSGAATSYCVHSPSCSLTIHRHGAVLDRSHKICDPQISAREDWLCGQLCVTHRRVQRGAISQWLCLIYRPRLVRRRDVRRFQSADVQNPRQCTKLGRILCGTGQANHLSLQSAVRLWS